jgi:cytochrome c peroxidase
MHIQRRTASTTATALIVFASACAATTNVTEEPPGTNLRIVRPLGNRGNGNGGNGNGNDGNGGNGNGNGNGNGGNDGKGGNGSGATRITSLEFPNATGTLRTYTDNPGVSLKATRTAKLPFFQSVGTNGRACIHCHLPGDGWGITPQSVQYRFSHPLDTASVDCLSNLQSCGLDPNPQNNGLTDPIFRVVDGANSPNADVSSPQARLVAFSMLLNKGLIRVGIGIRQDAEFTLAAVDDPYGYASASELSLFRRPLPTTNLRLSRQSGATAQAPVLTTVMWDGRETLPDRDILFDLMDQANGATLGHAQATAGLSVADRQAIVDFETGLHTAQNVDSSAGPLYADGARGGPEWLATNQTFYVGINDVLTGDAVTHAPFTSEVFTLFGAWSASQDSSRAQIARGQAVFNRKPIAIRGVGGLNDALGVDTIAGTCGSCHDAPNYGHHSVKLPINIGTADGSRRTSDMPLYTLRNKLTGATLTTTDPGRGLVSGKWADVGKFKGPILRGLAARAPYFHNGLAATLAEVVAFYDARFGVGFTDQEKADLVAFLQAL